MSQIEHLSRDAILATEMAREYASVDLKEKSLEQIYKAEAALKSLRHYVFHMAFRSGEVK